MAVTCGFYDSINGDRRYTALDFGHIMDYLVLDGVYSYYPETGVVYDEDGHRNRTLPPFQVSAVTGRDAWKNPTGYAVAVGPGRAWFDHTWTCVTTPEIVPLSAPDPTGDKIDCVVLQMNRSEPVRANRLTVIEAKMPFEGGNTPYSDFQAHLPLVPKPPSTLDPGSEDDFFGMGTYEQLRNYYPELQGHYMHDDEVHDVPIAYIYRPVNAQSISDYRIFSAVGTSDCPYVANIGNDGALSYEHIFQNWSTQFDDFLRDYIDKVSSEYSAWHDNLLSVEPAWASYLNERSADFMRWLKIYDRAYHVWYQGSVNWTYEYIRNLKTENEEFERQWADAIQKAQDLLENGFTEYTQKIDEILRRFEDIDNLVDTQMDEAQRAIDEAIEAAKQEIQDTAKETLTQVVTEQMTTIVTQVVETSYPRLRDELQSEVENVVKEQLDTSFEDRLAELETLLDQYQQDLLGTVGRRVDQIVNDYTTFRTNIENDIRQFVMDSLAQSGDLQQALRDVVDQQLQQTVMAALDDVREEWEKEIKEELAPGISTEINNLFVERFDEEKAALIQYIKGQLQPLTEEAVDSRFNADFEAKQAELEQKIDEYAASVKQELAAALAIEVQNIFNEQFDAKYEELAAQLEDHVTETVTGMKTEVRDELQQQLSTSLTESASQMVAEKAAESKQELAEGLTQEVQSKFDEQFADKQTELEGKIQDAVDAGVGSLDGELDQRIDEKFDQVEKQVADAAEKLVTERINQTLSTVYKPKGTGPFLHLPTELDASMLGNVYNVKDAFTTDERFVEGPGKSYPAGTNIVVVDSDTPEFDPSPEPDLSVISLAPEVAAAAADNRYKFDVLPGFIDMDLFATADALGELTKTVEGLSGSIDQKISEQLAIINQQLTLIQGTLESQATDIRAAQSAASAAQTAADAAKATAATASSAASSAQTAATAATDGVARIDERLENDFLEKG